MSFQTGLSGLNAASKNLDVIGNNIANANTAGAKKSRAEFAEVIASTLGATGSGGQTGIGVEISAVSQEFSQGNISVTGNELDLAINGNGFFPLIPLNAKGLDQDRPTLYSRSGIFKLDSDGYVVNNNGEKLYGVNITDQTNLTGTNGPLKINTSASNPPSATTEITMGVNLNSGDAVWASPALAKAGPSVTVYDTQGNASQLSLYYRKTANNQWVFGTSQTPSNATDKGRLTFDANGKLSTVEPADGAGGFLAATADKSFNVDWTSAATAATTTAKAIFTGSTQYASAFGITTLNQNGYPEGSYTGLKVGEDGYISVRYSNGQSIQASRVTLYAFPNNQGLRPVGGGNWIQTPESGDGIPGDPGNQPFGAIRSGALEDSNVDLTAELVAMMTAQRAYQANVQTIKTQDQALSALTTLR